jgi:hypothetical protein
MDLIKDSYLIKFDSIHHTMFNISVEFVENYIFNSYEKKLLLDNMHNLFIYITPYNKLLKNIIGDDLFASLKKNNGLIIGFILLSDKKNNIQYIEYIDSRIKKYNIAYNMINIYETQYNVILLPYDILDSASKYWKKYFEKKYNIKLKDEYTNFLNKMNINENEIRWSFLFRKIEN